MSSHKKLVELFTEKYLIPANGLTYTPEERKIIRSKWHCLVDIVCDRWQLTEADLISLHQLRAQLARILGDVRDAV